MKNDCFAKIQQFALSVLRGAWITMTAGDVEILAYMRTGGRLCNRAILPTLEIAKVTCVPQRQGGFTALITAAEEVAAKYDLVVYVDGVSLYRLDRFLSNRGYVRKGSFPSYSFYLTPPVRSTIPPTAAEAPANDIHS
jgi:hypothetical protein